MLLLAAETPRPDEGSNINICCFGPVAASAEDSDICHFGQADTSANDVHFYTFVQAAASADDVRFCASGPATASRDGITLCSCGSAATSADGIGFCSSVSGANSADDAYFCSLGQLPPGWDEMYDFFTNQPYFVSPTGHRQWRDPRQAPPPPLPLPSVSVIQPHGLPSMNENKRKREEEHVQGLSIPLGPRGDGSDSSTASLASSAPIVAADVPPSVNASWPTMPRAMRASSSRLPLRQESLPLFEDDENIPPHAVDEATEIPNPAPLKREREASSEMHHGVPVISELRQPPARASFTSTSRRPSPYAVDRRVGSSRPKGKGRAE
ncbi:hypothetical protein CBER1_03479 [Cercospora berteroae]|uniref:WW domain-containing protein n=1 Tax=Cercospora berteroae TaxID=357750 RepID=A0A2S6CLU0_9PEZI|nr:hypothetical protein CBER1_03479 [Cercospora berteroae]